MARRPLRGSEPSPLPDSRALEPADPNERLEATVVVRAADRQGLRERMDRLATGDGATSRGGLESTWTRQATSAMDQAFQAAAAMGITVCVAAGDNGSTDGVSDGRNHVDFPAVLVDGASAVHGGTSAVPPLWAGLIARINALTGRTAGFVNPALYRQPSALHDITRGNNGGFAASPGWDACTGLGSPDGVEVAAVAGV